MSKQAFNQKIEALQSLRTAPSSPSTLEHLRKSLKERNNYLVSKAATIAGELGLQSLVPDLLAAFDRFLTDAPKSDPQCWAKNSIAKALKDLGHRDAAVFLRGMAHFQPEPVWGGHQDTAATLRGTCALALVECPLGDLEILVRLTDLLADPEKPVRIDAARAIAQLGRPEGMPVLRLKALLGDGEPEVVWQCFASLLSLSPRESVGFVGRFLNASGEDVRLEAVAALGECREPEALDALRAHWRNERSPESKKAMLVTLAACRQPATIEFLVSIVEQAQVPDAAAAIVALAEGSSRTEVRDRVAAAVERRNDPNLTGVFQKEFARR